MGLSCSTRKNSESLIRTHFDWQPITSGDIDFKVQLKNITVHIPGVKQCSVEVDLVKAKYSSPNHISIEFNHFWRASYQTHIRTTEEQMKVTNITIKVLPDLGSATVNMFAAAVGPHHFDLQLKKNNSSVGRVQFHLKLQQIIQAEVSCIYMNCLMNSSISDVGYNYNLRLVTSQLSFISEHSETFINPNYRKRDDQSFNSRKSLNSMHETSPNDLNQIPLTSPLMKKFKVAAQHEIEWDNKDQPVGIIVELPINEVHNSAIQVCIWSVANAKSKPKILQQNKAPIIKGKSVKHDQEYLDLEIRDHHLVAETYISLAYLEESLEVEFNGIKFIQLSQAKQLWYHGVEVGQIKFNLNLKIPPHLEQTTFGVHTEQGIAQQISIVGQIDQVSITELQQLNQEFLRLSKAVFKLEHKKLDPKDKLDTRFEAQSSLARIEALLALTHDAQLKSFQYKSEEDLLKAQQLFIQLSEHLMEQMTTLENIDKDRYYNCLNLVMQRGELSLPQMGFFKELSKKLHEKKTNICLQYQQFLVHTLKEVLARINQKDPNRLARQFLVRFVVIAYFRVPQFRAKLLECVIRPDDPPLSETRGTEFIQEEDPQNIDKATKQNTQILDWQNHFHAYLQDQKKALNTQATLNSILEEEAWKENINHRSTSFSQFVSEWANYVSTILHGKILPWQDIPGYRTLTKALMCEIKVTSMITDAMKTALKSLLLNPNLLNIVVNLMYNKTNLFDSDNVMNTFDVLNMSLMTLQQNQSNMPPYFDYPFFLKGIKLVLSDSEHAMCIAKCLWMIYNNYPIFSLDFKKDLIEFLFDKVIWKLFFHWSRTVRQILMGLLIYRIYHNHRNANLTMQDEEILIKEYALLARPKKQQSYFENRNQQNQLISDFIYVKYFRFLGKVSQARAKESSRNLEIDMRTPYQSLLHKRAEKLKEQQHPNHHSPNKSKFSMKELEYIQEEPAPIIKQMSYDGELDNKLRVIVPRQIMHKKHTLNANIDITEQQQRYIVTGCKEFDEVMKQYNNWRQQKMKQVLSKSTPLSEVEKSTIHLKFDVPSFDILEKIDEKEGAA